MAGQKFIFALHCCANFTQFHLHNLPRLGGSRGSCWQSEAEEETVCRRMMLSFHAIWFYRSRLELFTREGETEWGTTNIFGSPCYFYFHHPPTALGLSKSSSFIFQFLFIPQNSEPTVQQEGVQKDIQMGKFYQCCRSMFRMPPYSMLFHMSFYMTYFNKWVSAVAECWNELLGFSQRLHHCSLCLQIVQVQSNIIDTHQIEQLNGWKAHANHANLFLI